MLAALKKKTKLTIMLVLALVLVLVRVQVRDAHGNNAPPATEGELSGKLEITSTASDLGESFSKTSSSSVTLKQLYGEQAKYFDDEIHRRTDAEEALAAAQAELAALRDARVSEFTASEFSEPADQ